MQEKSHNESQVFSRVEKLRVIRDLSWDETASLLDCNRSYFFHLKAGRKVPSAKFLYKLESAEIAAGIPPPSRASSAAPSPVESSAASLSPLSSVEKSAAAEVPIIGTLPAEKFQSLEDRLTALEADMKEMLKLLKGLKR